MNFKKLSIPVSLFVLPFVSFAQQLTNVKTLVTSVGDILKMAIPILFTLALLGFFWGLIMFIFGAEEGKEGARKKMVWGIVALAVMSSIWGLVKFLGDAVGVGQDATTLQTSSLIPK